MSQVLDFVPLWTLILGMAVFFYVLFDGFDLGVGMAQFLIQLTAWSVSPPAIACWTASVHNFREAYQSEARR